MTGIPAPVEAPSPGARPLVLGTVVVTLALISVADLLTLWQYRSDVADPAGYWFEITVGVIAYCALGALIALRAPGNRMGRFMLSLALVAALQGFSGAMASSAGQLALPAGVTEGLVRLSSACQVLFVGGTILLLLLAPTGRALTGRWRFVIGITVLGMASQALARLLFGETGGDGAQSVDVASVVSLLLSTLGVGVGVGLVAAPLCLFLRWHRARGLERQQVTWVVLGGLAVPGVIVLNGLVASLGFDPTSAIDAWLHGSLVWALAGAALPAGIAVAVLRHQLYDIDQVFSRTVSYALVTGVLVGVYITVVAIASQLLPQSSDIAVAAATLTVAAVFRPVLSRVQILVDRRFNRSRYDAVRIVEEFGRHLRDEVDPEQVSADLIAVLEQTLQPAGITLWLPRGKS